MAKRESKKLIRFKKLFLPRIIKKYRPKEVLLFGSVARGDFLEGSDLDLIIVSDAFKDIRFIDRAYFVFRDTKMDIGADILCYTEEEFQRKKEEICIVREAVKEGISLLH